MKIIRAEKFQPRKRNESRDTRPKTDLRKTDWEVLAQHDHFTGKLNLRCEAALKDRGSVKRLLEAGMIDPNGYLTPKGRKRCAELTKKLKQPESSSAAVQELFKAEESGEPENKQVDKLTASDWTLLMKYDRKTGNLLTYDPETGQLDQTSRAILRDPAIIQRLIDNNMILPGGWLTPEAKQECGRIEEKLKNQPADDYPDSKNGPEPGAKVKSQTKAEAESGKVSKKTEPEVKADPESKRFSDKLSKIYADRKGRPDLKLEPKPDPNPELLSKGERQSSVKHSPQGDAKGAPGPDQLSGTKTGADVGAEQQPGGNQASRAYAVWQHYPDPNANPEPLTKPEELSKGGLKPEDQSGQVSKSGADKKSSANEDLQAFFENLPDQGPARSPNLNPNPEQSLNDRQQTEILPEPLQTREPEKTQKPSKTGAIPIKGSVSGQTPRSVDLRPVSKPEDRHEESPKRRQKDSGGSGGDMTEPPRFSLRDVFHIIFKRKLQVLICFFFVISMAAVGTYLMTPVYEASAQIMVKLGRESVFMPAAGNVSPILNINREEQVNSEIEILKSRALAEKVVAAIGPTTLYPKLAEEKSGILNLIKNLIKQDKRREMTPDEREAADFESAIAGFMKALDVTGIKKSNVIQVGFKHQDPQMAAMVVNNIANMYLDHHLAVHKTPQNVKFFKEQTDLLKNKLDLAEEKLEALRKQHNITSLEQQRTLLLGQSSELNAGLNQTISLEVETEKRIRQLRLQLASVPETISQGVESDQNPYLMNTLQARLVELQLKEKELLTKYTDESRLVQNVKEEMRVVQQKLKEQETKSSWSRTSAVNPTYQRLKEELLRNEAEIEALKAKKITQKEHLDDLQFNLENLNKVELELKQLEQEIEVDRENYRLYLTKVEESRISEAMDSEKIASVSVIGPARPPREPVSPKVVLNILIGIFLGIFGSLSLALFREYLDDSIEKIEDVEKELQLPVLASIPIFEQKAAVAR